MAKGLGRIGAGSINLKSKRHVVLSCKCCDMRDRRQKLRDRDEKRFERLLPVDEIFIDLIFGKLDYD